MKRKKKLVGKKLFRFSFSGCKYMTNAQVLFYTQCPPTQEKKNNKKKFK